MSDEPRTETLHAHTILSDGVMTHREVLDMAVKYNVGIIAFTDHDILPPPDVVAELQTLRDHSTKWIMGIELTCKLPRELGEVLVNGFHIVGLFVDPTNEALLAYCDDIRKSRIEGIGQMVKNFQALGFTVTMDECVALSGGNTLARPHLAKALIAHSENLTLLDTYRAQMRQAAEYDSLTRERYTHMLATEKSKGDREQDIYALFMGYNDPFVKGVNVDYANMADMDTVVSLIRAAGGVALIAHYHTIMKQLSWGALEKIFAENRLDGAETVTGLHSNAKGNEPLVLQTRADLVKLVEKYNKLASGGVDFHIPSDFAAFQNWAEYSRATIGLTATLVKQSGVSTRWSSL